MSNEGFLERWLRRKRDVARGEKPVEEAVASPAEDGAQPGADDHRQAQAGLDARAAVKPAVDLSQLPPLDSITEATDIRAFLAPGVPDSLRHAALRRAWSADPTIRDFIGLSENAWDFTAPDGVPGFGPIGSPDVVRRLLAQFTGAPLEDEEKSSNAAAAEADQPPVPTEDSDAREGERGGDPVAALPDVAQALPESNPGPVYVNTDLLQHNKASAALQQESPATQYAPSHERRTHGRALPK